MAVAFRSAATAANGAAPTSLVVGAPAGTVDGDALVAFVTVSANATITTEPAGWTKLDEQATGTASGDCRLAVYQKVAAAEPASWTWGWSTAADCAAATLAYTGVGATVIDASASRLMASSTTSHTAPSVTPSADTAVLVAFATNPFFDGDTTFTTPAGLTVRAEADPGPGTTNRAVVKVFEAAGVAAVATGTKTTTLNNSAKGVAETVALKPSGSVPITIVVESRDT